MKCLKILFLLILALLLSGCVFTKIVTVPMRLGGAVISVVPVAGNPVDDAIDGVADTIDEIPI